MNNIKPPPLNPPTTIPPLREYVRRALENYFSCLDPDMLPTQLLDLVIEEVEAPLVEVTLKYLQGNQCKAAELLGISRSTLRKKIKQYQIS
ncbi:MAG: helix-turn-helix domain-containing protein [Gammaproteobacteria bacterium]